jgi:hypothetical protein
MMATLVNSQQQSLYTRYLAPFQTVSSLLSLWLVYWLLANSAAFYPGEAAAKEHVYRIRHRSSP